MIGNLLGLRVLLAGGAALALLVLSLLVQYEPRVQEGLRIVAPAAVALVLVGLPAIIFQSRLRLELAMLVEIVTSATTLILLIAVTAADLGFSAVLLATVGGATVAAATGYVLASRLAPLRARAELGELRRLTKASLPIGLFMIFGVVHFKVDTILLSIFKPLADVGTYSVAYRFLEQVLFIPGFFVAAVFPIITSYHATGDELLKVAIDKSFAFLVILAVPIATATFVLAPDIVRLVAGDEFEDAVRPLRILSFASIFFFTNALFSALLVIYERQRQLVVLAGSVVVGNIALNLVLIPPFSYTGAAVAAVITGACGGIAMMIWATRSVGSGLDLSPRPACPRSDGGDGRRALGRTGASLARDGRCRRHRLRSVGLSLRRRVEERPRASRTETGALVAASVVVPNLNGAHFLQPCLESLARQTLAADDVIVVDNGSTDGSVELVRDRYPEARLISFAENRGFAAAMNAGIAEARNDLIAFLNNDAVAEPTWLEELAACLARHPAAAAATSKLVLADDAGLPRRCRRRAHALVPPVRPRSRRAGRRPLRRGGRGVRRLRRRGRCGARPSCSSSADSTSDSSPTTRTSTSASAPDSAATRSGTPRVPSSGTLEAARPASTWTSRSFTRSRTAGS